MELEIDHGSSTPVYRQLAAWIETRIQNGELQPGRPIPSEATLRQVAHVSRDTVRRTIAHLRDRGVIYTVPHRGSYVTDPNRPTDHASQ